MVLSGAVGSPGIVMGEASLYKRRRLSVSQSFVDDEQVQHQLEEFERACSKAEQELVELLDHQQDESAEQLVRTQIEMVKDPELHRQIKRQIVDQNQPADAAVESVFETYLSMMNRNQSQDRSVDITDVRDRLIQFLHNYDGNEMVEGSIVVARELSPREVIECADHNVKGIVMDKGGINSHAAIMARSMGLPTVLGTLDSTAEIGTDDQLILDAESGQVIVNPNADTEQKYQELIARQQQARNSAEEICQSANKTSDGTSFCLRANMEFADELNAVKKYCAEGIGLLRTESIYLRDQNFKDLKQQESFYQSVLQETEPHPVVIRLFDGGGDKLFDKDDSEQNPFLGWRGIRMLLDQKNLLTQQLKAICKVASEHQGRVRILVPMVSTVEEVTEVRSLLDAVQEELRDAGIAPDDDIQLGIMVEVPNVALQADLFAEHADFLSIGTNDLTQYTLAVDRGNERIAGLYDQRHPSVWYLINKVGEAARRTNTPLSICGELASDPIAACGLLGLGISELSMNSFALPAVKEALCSRDISEMKTLGQQILQCQTMDDINQLFSNWKDT